MKQDLGLAGLFLVLLAIVTAGRWAQGLRGVPYDIGNPVFSIVTLTILSAVFYGAFTRRWAGRSVLQAMRLGALIGLAAQIVISASTAASYAFGIDSYFNHPRALNVETAIPFGEAMARRAAGLVMGVANAAVAAALGWVLGALLPPRE
jgi:hypothetical protein